MVDGSVLATQVENESTKQSTICFHQTLPVSSVSIDKYSSCVWNDEWLSQYSLLRRIQMEVCIWTVGL